MSMVRALRQDLRCHRSPFMLHRATAEAWTVYSPLRIIMVPTTMSKCSTKECGPTVYPHLASPSPEACLQNTVQSFEAIAASAERLENTVREYSDFSALPQRCSSIYSDHQDIIDSYRSETFEVRRSSPVHYLEPTTYETPKSPIIRIKQDNSSRDIFSPLQIPRSSIHRFPELLINTISVEPRLPVRLRDMVAQERALVDNKERMQDSSYMAERSQLPDSNGSAALPLRESEFKGNEGFQRLRMSRNLPPSLRLGQELQQERPMSSFSYSSDESDSSSGTRTARRLSILPRLGTHFTIASKKRKTDVSTLSTPQSETFQASKKGRKRSTSIESHRRFPRHFLILSPRLSKGPDPVTAIHANVLPNTSHQPSGPHTPYPRTGLHISCTYKRPVATRVADSIHIGTCQIRSILGRAKKTLVQTSQERRRIDLKKRIVRVDLVNQNPDALACRWV